MTPTPWTELATTLKELLTLDTPLLAITFCDVEPEGVPRFDSPMPDPADDGRTGRVPAGCVFWIEAAERTFATVPEDHYNCSVGSLTHGLRTLEEVQGNSDVAAILESGWATLEMVPEIPTVSKRHAFVTYGPLAEATADPDVVFLRLNAKQLMILHDAVPEMRLEGKPQCHIVAVAREQGEVAASVGCMLSRVRTGMPSSQVTCAIPGRRLEEIVHRLRKTCAVDGTVAAYAARDARRFDEVRPR